ncbi:MAG: sigma-54-dependent Fis family transcriptional regulator [Nitrospirae bacterium]|nr:sigma-54-dependent Fis family transcriptional regulator [Nitrospirota bacterium]
MEFSPKILVVDDEEGMRFFLSEALKKEGYAFETASDGREAVEKLRSGEFRIVLMDIKMPRLDGLLALEAMKAFDPDLLVILMTAFGSKKVALETLKKGAYDYFTKPFDLDEMRIVIKRAAERCRLQEEVKRLHRRLDEETPVILGMSPAVRKVLDRVRKVADSDVTVLITGESGTGKELVARAIHRQSPRRDHPFLTVNCASIPESLLETELFGHEKGAFTGAHQQRLGKFELAHEGSLFLDEVGEMPMGMQAKILRVLQEREIERIGGAKPVPVNIRIIAATNKDLAQAVAAGSFREDLFFRLNVVNIHLPPLRERPEDIPALADYFFRVYGEKFKRKATRLGDQIRAWLVRQRWPGNVRELENVIQRAVVLTDGDVLDLNDLRDAMQPVGGIGQEQIPAGDLRSQRERVSSDIEKKLIEQALAEEKDHRSAAAKRLGISRKHLYNKMKKYGLV